MALFIRKHLAGIINMPVSLMFVHVAYSPINQTRARKRQFENIWQRNQEARKQRHSRSMKKEMLAGGFGRGFNLARRRFSFARAATISIKVETISGDGLKWAQFSRRCRQDLHSVESAVPPRKLLKLPPVLEAMGGGRHERRRSPKFVTRGWTSWPPLTTNHDGVKKTAEFK